MSVARLLAGIVAAAALIFAALWWFARPGAPDASSGTGVGGTEAPVAAPLADRAEPAQPAALPAAVSGAEPLVPLLASARAQLAMDFERVRLAGALLDRLAAGEVGGVAAELRGRSDDAATLALHTLGGVCVARLGDTPLRAADATQWMAAIPDPATVARVDATIDAQVAWATKFRSGCESAGLLRGGELRAEVEQRIQQCSARGNPQCRAIAAANVSYPESVAMLRGAAVLGSVDAQVRLLMHLENAPPGTPEQQRAREQEARVWRESLAKADAGWRAAFLGCYEKECDPSRLDPAIARQALESAARDGAFGALLQLATSERVAMEHGGLDERGAPAAMAYVNPSETDAYAWRAVTERLAMQGCLGVWPNWASLVGATAAAERELRPSQLAEARELADGYWTQYGAPVAAARGCAE